MSHGPIVLVCGGRSFDEYRTVAKVLDELKPSLIVQGGASGADQLARKWADINGVPHVTYLPNWTLGKKGGPMRNQFMLEHSKPDWVVGFPGGRGTDDMIRRAMSAGVKIRQSSFISRDDWSKKLHMAAETYVLKPGDI